MWSRSTLVIAATPPSQALVASSRPPSPTSTTREVDPLLGEPGEDHRGQQLELGRRTEARGIRSAAASTSRQPGERRRSTGPAVDLRSARDT